MSGLDSLLEKDLLPDRVLRLGIRRLIRERVRLESEGGEATVQARRMGWVRRLRQGPIAIETRAVNEQHYEVPAAFFEFVLGRNLKYSRNYEALLCRIASWLVADLLPGLRRAVGLARRRGVAGHPRPVREARPGPGPSTHLGARLSMSPVGSDVRLEAEVAALKRRLGAKVEAALDPACALEMVHTASLIGNGMPFMDDATMRRGRPASHRVFGEAT